MTIAIVNIIEKNTGQIIGSVEGSEWEPGDGLEIHNKHDITVTISAAATGKLRASMYDENGNEWFWCILTNTSDKDVWAFGDVVVFKAGAMKLTMEVEVQIPDPLTRVDPMGLSDLRDVKATPRMPTPEMLVAAREWSRAKYNNPIGNDAATGCWQAMFDAAPGCLAGWQPIETAPHDRLIVVYAPGREGLQPMASLCQWHPAAGFCIDELREPICWMDTP